MDFPNFEGRLNVFVLLLLALHFCVGVPQNLATGASRAGDVIGSGLGIISNIRRLTGESPGEFQLFQHSRHSGWNTIRSLPDACVNLSGWWNDRGSSINTYGNCVILYKHADCNGAQVRIAPGTGCHSNLGDCGFNDRASSYSSCNY